MSNEFFLQDRSLYQINSPFKGVWYGQVSLFRRGAKNHKQVSIFFVECWLKTSFKKSSQFYSFFPPCGGTSSQKKFNIVYLEKTSILIL